MTQNRSSAVMAQRSEPHTSLDDFPTPPWATRLFLDYAFSHRWMGEHQTVLEPSANRGHMVKPLREYFTLNGVTGMDIHDYGYGFKQQDFLFLDPNDGLYDWVITNPPFRLAEQFIHHGLRLSLRGVAVLVRVAFLESINRYKSLFRDRPPTDICIYVERATMVKGRLSGPKGSTATAYAWLVWRGKVFNEYPPKFHWLPPARKRFEFPEDYVENVDSGS